MGNKLKLIEGAYENLITEVLNEEMQQAQETGLTCETGQIDSAESPSMIAQYLSDIIKRRLADDALSADEKMAFANRIVEMVSDSLTHLSNSYLGMSDIIWANTVFP